MVVTAVIELFPPFKPKPFTFCKSVDKYFRLSPVLVVQLSVNTTPCGSTQRWNNTFHARAKEIICLFARGKLYLISIVFFLFFLSAKKPWCAVADNGANCPRKPCKHTGSRWCNRGPEGGSYRRVTLSHSVCYLCCRWSCVHSVNRCVGRNAVWPEPIIYSLNLRYFSICSQLLHRWCSCTCTHTSPHIKCLVVCG